MDTGADQLVHAGAKGRLHRHRFALADVRQGGEQAGFIRQTFDGIVLNADRPRTEEMGVQVALQHFLQGIFKQVHLLVAVNQLGAWR